MDITLLYSVYCLVVLSFGVDFSSVLKVDTEMVPSGIFDFLEHFLPPSLPFSLSFKQHNCVYMIPEIFYNGMKTQTD